MNTTDRPPTRPIPTPAEFLATHTPMPRWSSGTYDEYDTVLLAADRSDDNEPAIPRIPKPRPGHVTPPPSADEDLIWRRVTAGYETCGECGAVIKGGSHSCKPKVVVAVGLVQGRVTVLRTPAGTRGWVTPAAVTEARRALRTAEQRLATHTLRGVKRWRVALHADSARAVLAAAGGNA